MENTCTTPHCKKVMIVDDNEIDLYIAEKNIQHYAFADEIILKKSARSALDYLQANERTPDNLPRVIFLDIRMPEMDGFGFLDEYNKLADVIKKKCIIMMLSSSLDREDHDRVSRNPFVRQFLNKPLNREKLEAIKLSEIGFMPNY